MDIVDIEALPVAVPIPACKANTLAIACRR